MNRQPYTVQKPENVLKRVDELIASATGKSADKEKRIGLDQLHNLFHNSKRKQWQKVYEAVMKRHLELCVDLKDNRLAKDGLHQYRNMALNADPNSLEVVILHLLDLAEKRAALARHKADKVALAAAAKISDLEEEETPESIMLSSMTEEGARDRTDREVVVPWLKFLWETYRAVLELVARTPKMERVYHKACERAFKICLDYKRVLEFRRLCETLRQHLTNLQKMVLQPQKAGKVQFEWTADGIELQLQTRFVQLEVATTLELWNESFRTVQDIHNVIQINKKMPKPRLLAIYYEKLTRIFWVAGNYLFHAYAWFRYYTLCCECRRDMKAEEKQYQANCVLLAALCIPSAMKDRQAASGNAPKPTPVVVTIGGGRHGSAGGGSVEDPEEALTAEKNREIALLLDFQRNPSRQALLGELLARGILSDVAPEYVELYHNLETQHHPLTMIQSIVPILESTKNNTQYSMYNDCLQKTAVVRATQRLSSVYNNVRISYVESLFAKLNFTYCDIEQILVRAAESRQLHIKIDHASGSFKFSTFNALSSTVDSQVANFGTTLHDIVTAMGSAKGSSVSSRQAFFQQVKEQSQAEQNGIVERRLIIERRKEGLERVQLERLREEKKAKDEDEKRRKEDEEMRLKADEESRQQAKREKYLAQLNLLKTKRALEAVKGEAVDEEKLINLSESSRQALLTEAQQEAQKEKAEEQRRLTEQFRRLDHITRAIRMEEAKVIEKRYQEKVERLRAAFEARKAAERVAAKERHEKALKEKARMEKMQASRAQFESGLVEAQRAEFLSVATAQAEKSLSEWCQRRVSRARKQLADDREAAEEERLAAEEAERLEAEKQAELARAEKAAAQAKQEAAERDAAARAASANAPPHFASRERDFGPDNDREMDRTERDWGRSGGDRMRKEPPPPSAADTASSWERKPIAPPSFGSDRDRDRDGRGFGSGFGSRSGPSDGAWGRSDRDSKDRGFGQSGGGGDNWRRGPSK